MDKMRVRVYGAAGAVLAADRFTKWLIETRVSMTETISVIPGFFDIVHSTNRGMAFGMLNDAPSVWRDGMLIGLRMLAVAVVGVMLWKAATLGRLTRWALALLLGGAAGNAFDHVVFGEVTDFLDFYLGDLHWPSFNVADSAIVAGCALLALDLLKPKPGTADRHVS